MSKTTIQWTDETLNPARGCEAVSPGCLNCYAARTATRFSGDGQPFEGLASMKAQPNDRHGRSRPPLAVWSGKVTLVPAALREALSWSPKKPKRVFVGSVTDMFHKDVPFEYLAALFAVMAATPWVTYQLVTKRPERMREFFEWLEAKHRVNGGGSRIYTLIDRSRRHGAVGAPLTKREEQRLVDAMLVDRDRCVWPLPNVWLLTSTENQQTFDERVRHLLACPAVVHGVSAEPLLGPIDMGLDRWVRLPRAVHSDRIPGVPLPSLTAEPGVYKAEINRLGALSIRVRAGDHGVLGIKPAEFERLHLRWVIVGGESGPGARPFKLPWARDIHRQVQRAWKLGIQSRLFLKQLGACAEDEQNGLAGAAVKVDPDFAELVTKRLKDSHGGDESEWPADLQGLRAFPVPAA